MRTFNFSVTDLRVILHILGACVWLGGQVVMMGLVPVLRGAGADVPKQAANAFNRIAWPFFVLLVFTGIWNIFAIDMSDVSTGYNIAFGIKFLLAIGSGVGAWLHGRATDAKMRGITAGVGFLCALGALILGVALAH